MPMLDVGWVAMDPVFADGFEVIRRKETVNQWGESTIQESRMGTKYGTVTQTEPQGFERKDDGTLSMRGLTIVTTAQIRTASAGNQPDIVVWCGERYTVKRVEPYHRFGKGFYQVVAEIQQSQAGAL